jgi:hypothetical protein
LTVRSRPHAERPVAGGQIDLAGGVRADVGKRLIDRAEFQILRRRHPEVHEPQTGELRRQEHQLFGPGVAERAQDHAVDDGENRRVGPDAERERQERDCGEDGRPAERPKRVANVPREILQPGESPLIAHGFHGLQEAAGLESHLAVGLFAGKTAPPHVFSGEGHVHGELAFHLAVTRPLAERSPQPPDPFAPGRHIVRSGIQREGFKRTCMMDTMRSHSAFSALS